MQPAHLLVNINICKAALRAYLRQVRTNQLLLASYALFLAECGLAHLLVTDAGTSIFPTPVLVAL